MAAVRTRSLRVLVVGVAVVLVGVLLLFLPHSAPIGDGQLECGSAAAESGVSDGYCAIDEWRFTAVTTMAGGTLLAVVAGLWPALRPARGPAGTSEITD